MYTTTLQESYKRATTLLTSRAHEHKLLAEALLAHETLDLKQIRLVIEGVPALIARHPS